MSLYKYFFLICLTFIICGSAATAEAFCSKVETGSSMWLTAGSITTQMGNRFISSDGPEMYNNVMVTEYAPGIPAQGSVSAFIRGRIMENGETMEFEDTTSVMGTITIFSKSMAYKSSQMSSLL